MSPIRALLVFIAACPFVLLGQNPTARVSGKVVDPTGAVIPQARVAVVNVDTGAVVENRSNESGSYLLSFVNAGRYELTVEAAGFRKYVRNIVVETGRSLELDFKLEIGDTSESVTVTAATPILQSTTSEVSQLIENRMIRNMPLQSGRAGGLVQLMANVSFQSEEGYEASLNFSLAGGRSRSGVYQLDGGNVTSNALLTQHLEFNPPVDAVQEIRIEANGYPAEFGHATGGIINMTSKSGTNQFHGTAWENVRNDYFDARSFFAPSVPPHKYNVFGATFGGPIRKDKTHFFISYEGQRRRDAVTRTYSFPTPLEVRGDFSQSTGTVLDPLTGRALAGNVIPSSRLDPVSSKLALLYTAPNVAGARSGANNYRANTINAVQADTLLAKLDHSFNPKDRTSARFIFFPATQDTGSAIPNRVADANAMYQRFHHYNAGPTWFHTFSPTLFNEASVTYSIRNAETPSHDDFTIAGDVGLKGVPPDGMPRIDVLGFTSLGRTNQQRFLKPQYSNTVIDGLSWFHGKHTVKFGGEWRKTGNRDTSGGTRSGQFTFNDTATGRGFALAALLLGWTNTADVSSSDTITRTDYIGLYIQDDWKVSSRLTLNVGLRWDLDTPIWETRNQQSGFNPFMINPVSGTPGVVTYAGMDGRSKYAHDWDTDNFGPRFGFAWRPGSEKTVLRGGYGLITGGIYDASLGRSMNLGFGDLRSFPSPDNGLTPSLLLKDGVPVPPKQPLGPGFGAVPVGQRVQASPDFLAPDHQNLYAHHASFNVQRELPASLLLEVGWLANLAHRIGGPTAININEIRPELRGAVADQRLRPFPQYSNVLWQSPNWGNSSFHALNIKVERRFSNGLSVLSTYAWSKFLDDLEASNEIAGASASGKESYYARHLDKSLSGNDIRHRLTANFVYELPMGRGKPLALDNRALRAIAGNWSLGMVSEIRSGSPFGVVEQSNRLNAFSSSQRSNIISDPSLPADRPRAQLVTQWFNTAAFAFPGNGQLGTAARAVGEGPGFVDFDFSLLKEIPFAEHRLVQLRGEFFNALNRPNFTVPNGSRGSAAFGQISSTVNPGRFIQVGVRVVY